jgi:hypothetical protein
MNRCWEENGFDAIENTPEDWQNCIEEILETMMMEDFGTDWMEAKP